MIHSYDVLMRSENSLFDSDVAILQSALLAINNLAMNGDNQKYFQASSQCYNMSDLFTYTRHAEFINRPTDCSLFL